MRLYLNPNDPEKTKLVSANGVPHYEVTTTKAYSLGPSVLRVRRPAETKADSFVADVDWKRFGAHPVITSNVFDGTLQKVEVREFLYKLGHRFSNTRYFLGDDDQEYRWKVTKNGAPVLTHLATSTDIAQFKQEFVKEGCFHGLRKWCLEMQPTTLDIDMIVTTFIIMEKRRRDRVSVEALGPNEHDEDVAEGGCEGGGMG